MDRNDEHLAWPRLYIVSIAFNRASAKNLHLVSPGGRPRALGANKGDGYNPVWGMSPRETTENGAQIDKVDASTAGGTVTRHCGDVPCNPAFVRIIVNWRGGKLQCGVMQRELKGCGHSRGQ